MGQELKLIRKNAFNQQGGAQSLRPGVHVCVHSGSGPGWRSQTPGESEEKLAAVSADSR